MSRKGGEGGLFCCCCCFCVHARNKRLLSFLGKHQRCSRQHVLLSFLAFGMHSGEAAFLRKTRMQLSGPCDFVDPERNTKEAKAIDAIDHPPNNNNNNNNLICCLLASPNNLHPHSHPSSLIFSFSSFIVFAASSLHRLHCAIVHSFSSAPLLHSHAFICTLSSNIDSCAHISVLHLKPASLFLSVLVRQA